MIEYNKQSIIAAVKQILPNFPVLFAYLFGSCARDNQRPLSDIDLAVFFDDSVFKDNYQKVSFDTEIQRKRNSRFRKSKVDAFHSFFNNPILIFKSFKL